MRNEKTMMALILDFAKSDDNIRAAYMNGSRANPTIPKDDHQDYDVVFACHDIMPYLNDHRWIDHFGQVAILQEADRTETLLYQAKPRPNSYIFLILYQDDVRTDLCFKTIDQAHKEYGTDSLTVLLMDKDQQFKTLEPASNKDYWIQKPSAFMVETCINEFYWCLQNVAKGLVRDQVPYALWMMNGPIREMQTKMIEWYIAKDHQYQIDIGAHGKRFKAFLPAVLYQQWESTISDAHIKHIWESAFNSIRLFSFVAKAVCGNLDLSYPQDEETHVTAHLRRLQQVQKSDL